MAVRRTKPGKRVKGRNGELTQYEADLRSYNAFSDQAWRRSWMQKVGADIPWVDPLEGIVDDDE